MNTSHQLMEYTMNRSTHGNGRHTALTLISDISIILVILKDNMILLSITMLPLMNLPTLKRQCIFILSVVVLDLVVTFILRLLAPVLTQVVLDRSLFMIDLLNIASQDINSSKIKRLVYTVYSFLASCRIIPMECFTIHSMHK